MFFFKQKTAYEMRISYWSSDVCSSDLLWLDTCAKNFTNPEAIKDFARSVHFTENPEYSPSLLNGSPGTVWDASLGNLLQVGLVVLDDGTCRVVARKADAETVNETFTKVLEGTRRPGLEVRQVSITHKIGRAHV